MKYIKILFLIVLSASLWSCSKKLDRLLVNPNFPDASTADVDLYLNQVQLSFTSFYNTASDFGAQLTRQQQYYGPLYNNGFSPNSFDGIWTTAYTSIIKNADAMIPLAQSQKKYVQSGIARVLKAYVLGTLVDYFDKVPASEADLGIENTSPNADDGASVYNLVFELLDSAISDFTKTGAGSNPTNDLFYGGNKSNWVKAAKTLKLKFYMQERLVDNSVAGKIQDLLTENDLINTEPQDFVFKYSTNRVSPDSRHPHYAGNYTATHSAGDFIANYFMWAIGAEKAGGIVSFGTNHTSLDPRLRFYFYRQRINFADVTQQSCPCAYETVPGHYPSVPDQTPFCLVGRGYWGRDHGDNTGIPPDGNLRSTWGIYPAGGQFDRDQGKSVELSVGGKGAGINPIWTSFFTDFLEAEAALELGISTLGTPRDLLEKGIRASMAKVLAFPTILGVDTTGYGPPTTGKGSVDYYVNTVLTAYDAASSDDERLEIIMKEYYLAAWGNGVEPYNNYRRTGKPDNLQLIVTTPNPGFFIRSFFYPSVYVNRNLNAPAQKTPGTAANKVFWDNNPDDFIK
jgi:hypothetical protein